MIREYIKTYRVELAVFILYVLSLVTIGLYHEPWFDEFQSWGISKDSIYNILFVIPHYEGHPPLWHLILKCFSAFNVPAEIGLRIPNILFISAAVWLLIFKSPFKRIYRLILPFTYFLFYQYGIVNRCYSVLCFAVFLTAYLYKTRNERPFRYILALCLMSLSSAYGLITALGLALLWSAQIIKERSIKNFLSDIFKDKRTQSLFILAITGILIAAEIFPKHNAIAINNIASVDYLTKFLYAFFCIPADAIITNITFSTNNQIYFYEFMDLLKLYNIPDIDIVIKEYWVSVFIGIIANIILFKIFRDIKQLPVYFMIVFPFLMICYAAYVWEHHIGIYVLLLLCAFWIAFEKWAEYKQNKIIKYLFYILLAVQLFWTYSACRLDIFYNYNFGREAAGFIKTNKLDNYKIMSTWLGRIYIIDRITKKEFFDINKHKSPLIINHDIPCIQMEAVSINQYFNKNLFYNFEILFPNKIYVINKELTKDENNAYIKQISTSGVPDVLLGDIPVKDRNKMYNLVKNVKYGRIFKNVKREDNLPIFIKKELTNRIKYDDNNAE